MRIVALLESGWVLLLLDAREGWLEAECAEWRPRGLRWREDWTRVWAVSGLGSGRRCGEARDGALGANDEGKRQGVPTAVGCAGIGKRGPGLAVVTADVGAVDTHGDP